MMSNSEPHAARPRAVAGYALEGVLGVGPLGKVYLARRQATGEQVVFRGFHRPHSADPEQWAAAVERFGTVIGQLRELPPHPNVQAVYDDGVCGNLYYLASEYVPGRTLRTILDEEGPRPLTWALDVFRQLAEAVEHLGRHGVVHGDLTPYNVMVGPDGTVRLINFGLSFARNRLGTPELAPELLRGGVPDHRSDVYGLGILLYEVLAGRPPFASDDVEQLGRQILGQEPPPIAGQSSATNAVLARLLAKTPVQRYRSATEALSDLEHRRKPASGGEAPAEPPVPWRAADYQPGPGLYQYGLRDQDFVAAQDRLEHERFTGRYRRLVAKFALAALLVALVSGTFSRVHQDHQAEVIAVQGTPKLTAAGGHTTQLRLWQTIDGRAPTTVRTGPGDGVTLRMRGDYLKVGENAELLVRRLDYQRGRVRVFDLLRGRVWARVAPLHRQAKFVIRAAGHRTTVKGTVYSVANDDGKLQVQTLEGAVQVSSVTAPAAAVDPASGQATLVAAGHELELTGGTAQPTAMSDAELEAAVAQAKLEVKQTLATRLGDLANDLGEATLMAAVDATFGLFDRGGAGAQAANALNDVQVNTSAHVALGAIASSVAMLDETPESLTLDTLAELNLGKEGTERVLRPFKGHRLESYERLGPEKFTFTARVDDTAGTLLTWRNGKVTERAGTDPDDAG